MQDFDQNEMKIGQAVGQRFIQLKWFAVFLIPALIGLGLVWGVIRQNSATYDETAYVRIACQWWKTGDFRGITRMGSPVTFWKWQTTPALVWMELSGRSEWIEKHLEHLPESLVAFRISALSFWLAGLWVTQAWAARLYGKTGAFFAGFVYSLGPNLLAHGSLLTMECPLWACWTFSFFAFHEYLISRKIKFYWISAIFAGLAFSMKFTAVLIPPIVFICLLLDFIQDAEFKIKWNQLVEWIKKGILTLIPYCFILIITNLVVTGFATIPLSEQTGEHPFIERLAGPTLATRLKWLLESPWPVDWVGFLTQMKHQRGGGPGYLFGEISTNGWKWYYLVATAVKVPVVILAGFLFRLLLVKDGKMSKTWLLPVSSLVFLAMACLMSKRNYGFRYLLPLAPVMIVWLTGLVTAVPGRVVAALIAVQMFFIQFQTHPWELTYFNAFAGSAEEGRKILADSNLDWGQGLLSFNEILKKNPEMQDLTLFYFGDVEPKFYHVPCKAYKIDASDQFGHLPKSWNDIQTRFIAVSTSLSDGPWGPTPFFNQLREIEPVTTTPDGSIRVYETQLIQAKTK